MNDRAKKFAAGLFTGYAAILCNLVYTGLSIPLALHYLGKQEFGLWALAVQISGYLMLLDFGISSALTRLLANHKQDINGGDFGALLLTSTTVFLIQGLAIVALGVLFSLYAPDLFSIPQRLHHKFQILLLILTVSSGLFYTLRAIGGPLWAFHRIDIMNFSAMMTLVVSFFALWAGFALGMGIYSFAGAGILSSILRSLFEWIICMKCGYYPTRGRWGEPSWAIFRQVFGFGKDVFLMNVGAQVVNASQVMIISRFVGLEAAAAFSIGTKIYAMGQQMVSKIMDSSLPALTEMFVKGEGGRMNARFWDLMSCTFFASCLLGTGTIMANHGVVSLWTSGIIQWSPGSDMLLGALLFFTPLSRCFISLFGIVGNYGPIRYIYVLESACFLLLAWPMSRSFAVNGVLASSLVAHLSTTLLIALVASKKYLEPKRQSFHSCVSALLILGVACTASLLGQVWGLSPVHTLLLALPAGGILMIVAWHHVLDGSLKTELLEKLRVPTSFRIILSSF
jgi:O-antigen/teichoic acid export membrane protein